MAFSPVDRYKSLIISIISRVFAKTPSTSSGMFTLDTFRDISFQPVSIIEIHFIKKFVVVLCLISGIIFIGTATVIGPIISTLDTYYYEDYINYHIDDLVAISSLSISAICSILIIKGLTKKCRFKLNADYIEDRFLEDDIVRIARKSKMGLFDKKKKKVILNSIYQNIDKFDDQHLLITQNGRRGIYSIIFRKIIIPVRHDYISPFVNSVATAKIGADEFHYDVKGNRLE